MILEKLQDEHLIVRLRSYLGTTHDPGKTARRASYSPVEVLPRNHPWKTARRASYSPEAVRRASCGWGFTLTALMTLEKTCKACMMVRLRSYLGRAHDLGKDVGRTSHRTHTQLRKGRVKGSLKMITSGLNPFLQNWKHFFRINSSFMVEVTSLKGTPSERTLRTLSIGMEQKILMTCFFPSICSLVSSEKRKKKKKKEKEKRKTFWSCENTTVSVAVLCMSLCLWRHEHTLRHEPTFFCSS